MQIEKYNHFNCVFSVKNILHFVSSFFAVVTSDLTSGSIKVVLGSFDSENFRRQKHQLNANKCFS